MAPQSISENSGEPGKRPESTLFFEQSRKLSSPFGFPDSDQRPDHENHATWNRLTEYY